MRPKSPPFPSLRVGCAVAAAAAACAGCSDLVRASRLQPAGVNVESPAAGAVLAAQARRTPYPSFRDVPPRPADVPPPATYVSAVGALKGEQADFRAWERENPPAATDAPAFADATRRGLQAGGPEAAVADQTQVSTEWARRARDAAKAPFAPPPKP